MHDYKLYKEKDIKEENSKLEIKSYASAWIEGLAQGIVKREAKFPQLLILFLHFAEFK